MCSHHKLVLTLPPPIHMTCLMHPEKPTFFICKEAKSCNSRDTQRNKKLLIRKYTYLKKIAS